MSYYATIVIGRSTSRLLHVPGVEQFGYPERLMALTGDWQLLYSTPDVGGTFDFELGLVRSAEATGAPVLEAYICDSSCTVLRAAGPGQPLQRWHLPAYRDDCHYEHDESLVEADAGETLASLTAWCREAGFEVEPGLLASACGGKRREEWFGMDGCAEKLTVALGLGMPVDVPMVLDYRESPQDRFLGSWRLGGWARSRIGGFKMDPDYFKLDGWEYEALEVERELFYAAYTDGDHAELLARAQRIVDQVSRRD